jgi:methionyl aminopeptidase
MMLGIAQVKPGNRLGDIGYAIQTHAEKHNYSVVRDYCGHGVGKVFHAAPNVMHYGEKDTGMVLEEGMFFTVEPMINVGGYETRLNAIDGWTVTTRARSQPSLNIRWLLQKMGLSYLRNQLKACYAHLTLASFL